LARFSSEDLMGFFVIFLFGVFLCYCVGTAGPGCFW
jgi:hypothetical protein